MKKTTDIPIGKIELNNGQIEGLPKNPRFIRDERYKSLVKSIQDAPEMLELRELLVYPHGGKYVVIGGNMRLRACRELKHKEIPCKVLDENTSAEKLREYAMKDNIAFGDTDWDIIANEWDVDELSDWGVEFPTDFELPGEGGNHADEDDFDEDTDNVEARTEKGDVWQLGAHRLMCGDSTNPDNLRRLLGEITPDLIYTDPPYGMNAVSNSGVLKEKYKSDIHGDDDNTIAIAAFKLCQSMFPNARQVWWGANYYTECLPNSECWLVWDKNNGMSDQADCELAWANFRSVVRQFTMVSEKTNRIHPTQKPCKLFGDIVVRMKKKDNYSNVLDLFGGSGSTMIACEQMGITSFTMEYEPHYCDVIIARWEKMTNQKAERIERYERKEPNSV